MIYFKPEDSIHVSYLSRILIEIADNTFLNQNLFFKGGTCAAMLGFLDRLSVDLDFDIKNDSDNLLIRKKLVEIFNLHNLTIVKDNPKVLEYVLKYQNDSGKRNNLKISALNQTVNSNVYQPQYLSDIDRIMNCQTIDSMFANKLVAITDRFNKYQSIAGRDIYDIHHFFIKNYKYDPQIIKERTGLTAKNYLIKLKDFINQKVTNKIINEDLNMLLPNDKFQQIRKILLQETINFLSLEISRIN